MYCRICGIEDRTRYYTTKRQALCRDCARRVPPKVSREAFDRAYWAHDPACPEDIRREFYADYLHSGLDLTKYIAETTSQEV